MATLRELFGPGVEKVSKRAKLGLDRVGLSFDGLRKGRIVGGVADDDGLCGVQLRIEQRTFLTPTKRKIEINIVQSNYHIELTPS